MEKICNTCNQLKPYSEYYLARTNSDGLASKCKSCTKKAYKSYHKKYYSGHKDNLHHVYILPEEHYAGTTSSVYSREINHRNQHNRDTTGMRVIYSTKNREEALELESLLHDIGYKGRHPNGAYL